MSIALGLGAPPIPKLDVCVQRILNKQHTEQRLRGERDQARMALQKLSEKNIGARQLLQCFDGWHHHATEAKALLRTLSKAAHPDKYSHDPVTRQLAQGLQSAINYLRSELN